MLDKRSKNITTILSMLLLVLLLTSFFVPNFNYFSQYNNDSTLSDTVYMDRNHSIYYDICQRAEEYATWRESPRSFDGTKSEVLKIVLPPLVLLPILFITACLFAVFSIFFSRKKPFLLIGNLFFGIASCIYPVFATIKINIEEAYRHVESSLDIGFYLLLTSVILIIIYFSIYFLYKKGIIPPPKPHNPTKSERIAELERQASELKQQVSELSANKKDTD